MLEGLVEGEEVAKEALMVQNPTTPLQVTENISKEYFTKIICFIN